MEVLLNTIQRNKYLYTATGERERERNGSLIKQISIHNHLDVNGLECRWSWNLNYVNMLQYSLSCLVCCIHVFVFFLKDNVCLRTTRLYKNIYKKIYSACPPTVVSYFFEKSRVRVSVSCRVVSVSRVRVRASQVGNVKQ